MQSEHGSCSKSALIKQNVSCYRGTFHAKSLAEVPETTNAGVKETAGKTFAAPVDDDSSGTASPETSDPVADGAKEQLLSAEQSLLDELQDIIATFGTLEGAVKVKLPRIEQHILVHGSLLTEKSSFCRKALTKNFNEDGVRKLTLSAGSVSVLAYFLKWVYNENILPTGARMCPYLAYDSMRWPDLVDLWIFARKMGVPKLQNHAVDILVRKIHCSVGLFGPRNRTEGEIIQMNTVLNMLWFDKYQTRYEVEEFEALNPLRGLMLDFVVNPLYQTKVDAEKLLIGGVPDGFFRAHTFYTIKESFNKGNDSLDDEADLRTRMEMIVGVKPDTLGRFWTIDPAKYHVDNVMSATSSTLN